MKAILLKTILCPFLIVGMALALPMTLRAVPWPIPVHVPRKPLNAGLLCEAGANTIFVCRVEGVDGLWYRKARVRIVEVLVGENLPETFEVPLGMPKRGSYFSFYSVSQTVRDLFGNGEGLAAPFSSGDVGATFVVFTDYMLPGLDYRKVYKLSPSENGVNVPGTRNTASLATEGTVSCSGEEFLEWTRQAVPVWSGREFTPERAERLQKWLKDSRFSLREKESLANAWDRSFRPPKAEEDPFPPPKSRGS
jgi:hypothetical protein